jgi:hypothetical protein
MCKGTKNALSYRQRDYKNIKSRKKVPDMKINNQSEIQSLASELFNLYDSYRVSRKSSIRFTQTEMLEWLHPLEGQELFLKSVLGTSSEGRQIALYTLGSGSIKVMLWSQMHGDEPTATMALMDMFNFLAKNPGHIVTKTIFEKLTLLVIPMLNPDGAERFTRRTAQMIDMNRDALARETPEARILKDTHDKYQPEYGFNLHDQDPRYTVGTTKKMTAMALFAPPPDESHSDTPTRMRAKRVASTLAQVLSLFIPQHLAKWDDTFTSTAFGDNMQKWGTSTVLIESGGWHGDPDKSFIRKLNCIGLLATLYALATGESDRADVACYEQIPFNMKLGFDYILRNATLNMSAHGAPARVDIGINFDKRFNSSSGQIDTYATIIDIGDLMAFTALEKEVNANGAELDADFITLDRPFSIAEIEFLLKRM